MIQIIFPDGSKKAFEKGITPYEIAQGISMSLAKKAVAAVFNDEYIELNRALIEDGRFALLTDKDEKALDVINHSTAHLMAQAIISLYPQACFGVGPYIEEGFYYDVDFKDEKINDEDLLKIENEMHRLTEENYEIIREEVSYEQAQNIFKHDPYKLEIIEDYKYTQLTVYRQGKFVDLCRGGHVLNTK